MGGERKRGAKGGAVGTIFGRAGPELAPVTQAPTATTRGPSEIAGILDCRHSRRLRGRGLADNFAESPEASSVAHQRLFFSFFSLEKEPLAVADPLGT